MLIFARLSLSAAVGLFFVALILSIAIGNAAFGILIPAGALLISRGWLMLSRRQEVLVPLAAAEADGTVGRLGFRAAHPTGAVLLIVIGLAWVGGGIYALL
jgi:hypothetical protein